MFPRYHFILLNNKRITLGFGRLRSVYDLNFKFQGSKLMNTNLITFNIRIQK